MRTIIAILLLVLAAPTTAGTWGVGQFENDHALDWSAEWAESGSVQDIRAALKATSGIAYLEAPEAEKALIAAEVVAAALGRPSAVLPEDLAAWVKTQPIDELQNLLPLAQSAVERVRQPQGSELYELWAEQGVDEWLASVNELETRLLPHGP